MRVGYLTQGDQKGKIVPSSPAPSRCSMPVYIFSEPVLPPLRREAEEISLFLEPTPVRGWIEKEPVPL